MTADSFRDIIETEKEIHLMLKNENKKASQWMKEQEEAVEKELKREQKKYKAASREQRRKVRVDAEHEAAKLLKNAALIAQKMADLDDASLRKIIKKHIHKILPDEQ